VTCWSGAGLGGSRTASETAEGEPMGKSIIFDMDGVILDSMSYHVRAWQGALHADGLSVPEEVLYVHEGAIEPETAVAIFEENGCPMDFSRFQRILHCQKEIFGSRYRSEVKPYPEVPAMLERLEEQGWELALVTSSHREILDMVLPREISDRMAHIVTGDQVARRKPYPDPYLRTLSALGRSPGDCLVVENAPAGIQAAKAAAIHCIALTTTLASEYLMLADAVLSSHVQLERYVVGWGAGSPVQTVGPLAEFSV
jgi:beta-phosphoglucomutase